MGKWLKAGIWEAGQVTHPEAGTPQGGVISPLLSNIYLHEVLDRWFTHEIKPKLRGRAELIRFADDFVLVCERREEAEALLAQVKTRFQNYGLMLHPEKTRIVDFRHPWDNASKPQAFDFLGFTHYWAKTQKGGHAMLSKTKGKKLGAALIKIGEWCKRHRHEPMQYQHRELCSRVRGHDAYYGIRGNSRALGQFRYAAQRWWHHWLSRRSRERADGERLWKWLDRYFPLPPIRIGPDAMKQQTGWAFGM